MTEMPTEYQAPQMAAADPAPLYAAAGFLLCQCPGCGRIVGSAIQRGPMPERCLPCTDGRCDLHLERGDPHQARYEQLRAAVLSYFRGTASDRTTAAQLVALAVRGGEPA
jgi:hypothetical protein